MAPKRRFVTRICACSTFRSLLVGRRFEEKCKGRSCITTLSPPRPNLAQHLSTVRLSSTPWTGLVGQLRFEHLGGCQTLSSLSGTLPDDFQGVRPPGRFLESHFSLCLVPRPISTLDTPSGHTTLFKATCGQVQDTLCSESYFSRGQSGTHLMLGCPECSHSGLPSSPPRPSHFSL